MALEAGQAFVVSILTQLTGWVLPCMEFAWGDGLGFNPHPAHRLGATFAVCGCGKLMPVSILTQLTGWVLRGSVMSDLPRNVSILTQLTGWVLRRSRITRACMYYQFQSSPSSQAGCYPAGAFPLSGC